MAWLRDFWSNLSPRGRRGVVGGAVAVVVLAVLGTAVALGGGDGGEEATTTTRKTTTTSATTTSVVVTTTTEPKTGPRAPLTGLKVGDTKLLFRPALAVKVDNLDAPRESALPQAGLPLADVVIEEIVEGNITRFVAVFHSHTPPRVGPVRSARTTDMEILPQFGKTLLAWSGANGGVTAAVRANPFIVDVGYDVATGSYHRDGGRRAPHNLFVNAGELWRYGEGLKFPNTLFHYREPGEKAPSGAPKAQGVDIDWRGVASAPLSWRWDSKARVYVRFQRGRPQKDESGAYITTKNVVVQVTNYGRDGNGSPVADTTASGDVFVYTNGREIQGTWNRPYPDFPAALRDEAGKPIKLSPGPTWVELPKAGMATTIPG